VEHPAAKSMIEIARTQDEEVGDGTTSVIILGNPLTLVIWSVHHYVITHSPLNFLKVGVFPAQYLVYLEEIYRTWKNFSTG